MSAGAISGSPEYLRDELDFYIEPVWCTELLLRHERFVGTVWDPAAGSGNVVTACREAGLKAYGTDIKARGFGWRELDFMEAKPAAFTDMDNIITNPPYGDGRAEAFVRKALTIARHKVAALVQQKFPWSVERFPLFTEWETKPARIYFLSSRPSMPPGELLIAGKVKPKGGIADYCWIVWSKDHVGPTTAHWLRRAGE